MQSRRQLVKDFVCRVLNVVVACVGLVLTAPLLLVIAAAIKLTSRGPVIFSQQRVGLDRRRSEALYPTPRRNLDMGGRIFTIYKFRTMHVRREVDAEVWASQDDPRVTAVGRWLRATRLDELPQFVNVLKGDMNIVGPRPEQPRIFEELCAEVGRYRHRQKVLPGITGLAQIEVGYDTDLEGVKRKIDRDLEYIRRRSPTEDLMIMARTVPVMVFGRVWK